MTRNEGHPFAPLLVFRTFTSTLIPLEVRKNSRLDCRGHGLFSQEIKRFCRLRGA